MSMDKELQSLFDAEKDGSLSMQPQALIYAGVRAARREIESLRQQWEDDKASWRDVYAEEQEQKESLRAELAEYKSKEAARNQSHRYLQESQAKYRMAAENAEEDAERYKRERDEARQALEIKESEYQSALRKVNVSTQVAQEVQRANAALLQGLKDIAAESNDHESRYVAYRLIAQYDTARPIAPWNTVSQRPAGAGHYLVSDGENIGFGYYLSDGSWFAEDYAPLLSTDITHWMPIPAAPTAQEEK